MASAVDALIGALLEPATAGLLLAALVVGLLLGWSWKPSWSLDLSRRGGLRLSSPEQVEGDSGVVFGFLNLEFLTAQLPSIIASSFLDKSQDQEQVDRPSGSREPEVGTAAALPVTTEDLEGLRKLVEDTDGGPPWLLVFDRSMPTYSYQAWRRDQTGPPMYKSRTVFEDATPETVRDFFWDDEFRFESKWDDMLLHHEVVEECPDTGAYIVHWVRKFPFFCSDREYTIGRRIWQSGSSYYCVTKGVPCPSVPRRNKPRRVDIYYSSWFVRTVESRRGDGQMTACEVTLFHCEDMGIPWEIAKLGVRQGMWAAVKKIDPGLRAYQSARTSGESLSRSALLAQKHTRIDAGRPRKLEVGNSGDSITITEAYDVREVEEISGRTKLPKFLIVGGAVALACTLDRVLMTKALVIFGVVKKFARAEE